MTVPIEAVLTGSVAPFGPAGELSAMAKHPVFAPLWVGALGLAGDQQADLVHHGGTDKAIHHYPRDHYPFWQNTLPGHPLLEQPGAFGENISTTGLTETQVCIGDRFRLGQALVEVSQGRQPCWKLGHRFGNRQVPARMVMSNRSGWYFRVIEHGAVAKGDRCELVARGYPDWTVARVFSLLIGGEGKHDLAAVRALAGLGVLAESWRMRAAALAC